MPFTDKTLQTLEYPKIIARLAEHCATDAAKRRAFALVPSTDKDKIVANLTRTADARRLIGHKGFPSFYGEEEISASADRAEKGAVLSPTELLRVAHMLRCARGLIDYISADKPFETTLDEIFLRAIPNRDLEEKIFRSILSEDTIADEASPALADIRRRIKVTNNKIRDTLQSYVGGQQIKYLQENLVTMRDGRYVIPVKAEYRNEVKGLVHDTSASGATIFIEPMAIVEANNKLRQLQAEEAHEIERILAALSAESGDACFSIRNDFLIITDLAFVFACGALADEMKCACPNVVSERYIDLKQARHPLIARDKVVANDITLGKNFSSLVITGPNTGGKTVTLKTAGLLCAMAQAGLHIPAREESVIGVCSDILADIGDEQSIEQSLSTFSSHMVNIVDILSHLSPNALILFDELGAGTDPVEGAALAISILEQVRQSGALVLSTTHYPELKMYALDTDGVENASCEFDVSTLKPTYRLIVGMPGKSNAFNISEKLGLPKELIENARLRVGSDDRRFESIVEQLEKSRIEMEHQKKEAEALRRDYEIFKAEAERKLKDKIKEAEESAKRDSEKAKQLLDSTRVTCEFVLKELEDMRKKQGTDERSRNLAAARKELRERLGEAEREYEASAYSEISFEEDYVLPRPLKVGDRVFIVTYHQEGTVTALPDKNGQVQVQAGIMRAKVAESELRLIENVSKPKPKKPSEGKVKTAVARTCKIELDVRGEYAEDAWEKVDRYIDDALLSGLAEARIIHGKGTGKLRVHIQNRLRTDRRIKSYRNGSYGEGDMGVTVIVLK